MLPSRMVSDAVYQVIGMKRIALRNREPTERFTLSDSGNSGAVQGLPARSRVFVLG
jgi:hypothetical protein